jgi:hypothetical protein
VVEERLHNVEEEIGNIGGEIEKVRLIEEGGCEKSGGESEAFRRRNSKS